MAIDIPKYLEFISTKQQAWKNRKPSFHKGTDHSLMQNTTRDLGHKRHSFMLK
jgi:hypothetical protein